MTRQDIEVLVRVYDLMRTARMSVVYYELRLRQVETWNLIFDITAAVVATGSGVTGWAIWGTHLGRYLWAGIAAFASLLAALKPVVGTHRKTQAFAKQDEGWTQLFIGLEGLSSQILIDQKVTKASGHAFSALQARYSHLSGLDEKPQRLAVRTRAHQQVSQEITPESLRLPPLDAAS